MTPVPSWWEPFVRGLETAGSSWAGIAAGAPGASVIRSAQMTIAVFPKGSEREYYNNATVVPGLGAQATRSILGEIELAYADAGIDHYAVWAHEADGPLVRTLEERGYVLDETTRSMAVELTSASLPEVPAVEIASRRWEEYRRTFLPPGLLTGVVDEVFHVLFARHEGRDAAAALAHDSGTDRGIFNVGTQPWARRHGIARALTLQLIHDARDRGLRTATLQSTPAAERVYAAAGFVDLGRILEFVPGP